ncbi:pilus assembly protein CpaF [Clostridium thermosuccinogenes]|uniref:Pilus assembly protein CpaF n=1 Tax=Clostridium thermosuccinogenes TaxID=84032 RepID=A0A2K2FNI7_9CLOT|nr:ATPase, T2SS/T4P/T4SS family [Pseudoclostridium thermosuccinogenes]AUS97453.1 pilus assembly protein CpaF [Pseudoclostridium thermosuccinogenes]PNT98196.1 pilus assembly protein CpaF [Pseudoclostridium thermosuccinogenes]PNU00346.1 pilus assembly protein CpaF [Pseudoclostridium thermosuccinogenes]
MNHGFSVNDLIYRANKLRSDSGESMQAQDYSEILDKLQRIIAKNHSSELAQVLYSEEAEEKLKDLIMRYLNSEQLVAKDKGNISELVDAIYYDMAGMGLLSPYLQDTDTEEINVNGYGGIWVLYRDRKVRLNETFGTPEACSNIVRKMSRFGNVILDGSKPIGDSFIARGVRMSGAISPCVDPDAGAIASIRKQKPSFITRENLIEWDTATAEELDFLTLCVNNGVSVAIAGATGSGKTADMGYILSCVPPDKRIVTIEDTRELSLAKFDENGVMINDVIHLLTKEEPNPISMLDLLKLSLRLHPEILVPAEMRGKEALTVQEAGRTGHTIVSTLHANSARTAYDRILTMCLEAGTSLSEERLLKNIVEAFPIMLFKMQLPDKSRKYMEIFEATGVENGEVTGNTLYKYVIDHYERDKDGKIIKAVGTHRRLGCISPALAEKLLIGGVPQEEILRFTEGGA